VVDAGFHRTVPRLLPSRASALTFGSRRKTPVVCCSGACPAGQGQVPLAQDRDYIREGAGDNVAMNGTIKRLVVDRGFGFLSGEDGKEYFFHRSSVDGSFEGLQEGQKVTFDVEPSAPKGPRASRVRVA